MYMVMLVLDDPDRLDDVLDAWDRIGVSGATIIESSGINRRRMARQVGTTFMAGINRLINRYDEGHFTLLVVVPNEALVQACLTSGDIIAPGQFLSVIDDTFAIAGLLAINLIGLGLIGNLARVERRFLFVELDALLILVGYLLGMYILFARGVGV